MACKQYRGIADLTSLTSMSVISSRNQTQQHNSLISTGPVDNGAGIELLDPRHVTAGTEIGAAQRPTLLWIAQGAVNLEWQAQRGSWRPLHLRDGDFYLSASGCVQLRRAYDCQSAFEGMRLYIDRRTLIHCASQADSGAVPLHMQEMAGTADPTLRALLELLHLARRQARQPSSVFIDGLTQAIVSQLVFSHRGTGCSQPGNQHGLAPYKFRLVSNAMRDRLSEPFDLEHLAELAGLSTFHFSRSFKKASGVAPSRYFQRLRIEKAMRMLSSEDEPIINIALAVGFRTPSHFSQVFRDIVGVSPRVYRTRLAFHAKPGYAHLRASLPRLDKM
jgi:AraC family transcriptional regulator